MNYIHMFSNASIVKANIWLITISALSGNIASTVNGILRKPKKLRKPELT